MVMTANAGVTYRVRWQEPTTAKRKTSDNLDVSPAAHRISKRNASARADSTTSRRLRSEFVRKLLRSHVSRVGHGVAFGRKLGAPASVPGGGAERRRRAKR